MAEKTFTKKALVGVVLMMVFGTGTMIAAKLMLDTKTPGLNGEVKKFDKAMYQSILMFFAMSMCYPWYQISELLSTPKRKTRTIAGMNVNTEDEAAFNEKHETLKDKIKNLSVIAFPALCDLLATTLMTTGLIYIRVSVMQMLRGSMVVFSAILTITFRKRKLRAFEWFGVCLCCLALVLVGAASIVGSKDKGGGRDSWAEQLMGCLFVIGSQVIQAVQIVVEELLLSDMSAPPLVVVGMEGFWGMLMSIFVFIPIFHFIPGEDNGRYENTHDTFYRVLNSPKLLGFSALYWISILLLNYGGMVVTSELTAVHRTIFEALRTLFIWITQLIIYSAWTEEYGEDWNSWSYMQAGGFIVLVCSMLIYNQVIKLRFLFNYASANAEVTHDETVPILDPKSRPPVGYTDIA